MSVHEAPPSEADAEWGARASGEGSFAALGTVLFAIYASVVSAFHEPWRDETQTWRLAIDSDGIAALVRNARAEGHPLLFHLLLQLVGHLSRSWWAAVALHVAIATGGVWLLLRHAPFTRAQRILAAAGYFVAYEYAIVVRPYGLGMLLGFGACLAWTSVPRRPWIAAVLLCLMANTSVFGAIVAFAAAMAFTLEWASDSHRVSLWPALGLTLGVALGAAVIWMKIVSPGAVPQLAYFSTVDDRWNRWRLARLATIPLQALTPLARMPDGGVVWGTWRFASNAIPVLAMQTLVSAGLMVVGALIAARRRVALLFYGAASAGLLLAFGLIRVGYMRHFGTVAIAWLMTAWLAGAGSPSAWPAAMQRLVNRVRGTREWMFALSLVPMVFATAQLAVADLREPFSDASRVARLLRAPAYRDVPILAVSRPETQTVAALLDRPVYMALEGRAGTFVDWSYGLETAASARTAVAQALASRFKDSCRVVVVSNRELVPAVPPGFRAEPLDKEPPSAMSREDLRLWLFTALLPRCDEPPERGRAQGLAPSGAKS